LFSPLFFIISIYIHKPVNHSTSNKDIDMDDLEATGSDDQTKACPRGHWRPGEDGKLRRLVEQYGPQNWNSIAEKLQGRSGSIAIYMSSNQYLPLSIGLPLSSLA